MSRFSHFAAIDWSGARGERQPGIAVAICTPGQRAPALVRPGDRWSRSELLAWLRDGLPPDTLVGIDISPAFPFADAGSYFPGWSDSPPDARALWALADAICAGDLHLAADGFVDHPEVSRHLRRPGGRTGDRFGTGAGRLRAVEHRLRRDPRRLAPYSCLNLVGAAQVGKASLTAMRVLHRLERRLPVWPFDPLPARGSVIVEIYTSLAAREAGLPPGRSKLRDGIALDAALGRLSSHPHAPLAGYNDHATDALLAAAWLRRVANERARWHPPGLEAVARTEGWTFGVL